ncbi:CAP domain-containing protein [Lactobacillaceae bacterium Melli_B3]
MKKNKLMLFSVVTLLSFSAMGTVNNINNLTAQAKATKVTKKHHKKHLSKHEKLLQEVRASVKHPKKSQKATETTKNAKVVNGYDETNDKITDMNTYINVATQTSINKLNAFRQSQGLNALQIDNGLTQIAQLRAKQSTEQGYGNLSHYNQQGQFLGAVDAQQLNIMSFEVANNSIYENLGLYSTDTTDTPINLGNQSIQDAINEGPTGGHYQNDVNKSVTKCGVGFYINDKGIIGYALDLQ